MRRRLGPGLRGFHFRERDPSAIPAADLTRLDAMWTAAVGLAIAHTIHVGSMLARQLLLALEVGDRQRVARALAMQVGFTAVGHSRRHLEKITAAAEGLARQVQSPHVDGILLLSKTVLACHSGRFRLSVALADEAESLLRERCTGVVWEAAVAQIVGLWCLWHLGRAAEVGARARTSIERADDRGNRWAATTLAPGFGV